MKITSTNIETVRSGGPTGVGGVGTAEANKQGLAATGNGKTDTVNLSSANRLVSIAKASASSARAEKLANVAALVRSGQYTTDIPSVSHAVVQGHIQ